MILQGSLLPLSRIVKFSGTTTVHPLPFDLNTLGSLFEHAAVNLRFLRYHARAQVVFPSLYRLF